MNWDNLTSVPADFADGTDNDATYAAGFGLNLSTNQFSVDTATLETRLNGICAAGNSIRVINADGTVLCESDTTRPTRRAPG